METSSNLIEIRCGDIVRQWFNHADMRVLAVRRHHVGPPTIHAVRLSNGHYLAIPQTTSLVVVFRPLTNEQIFEVSEGIARDRTTGCISCGSQWQRESDGSAILTHRADCRYRRTLDEMPG